MGLFILYPLAIVIVFVIGLNKKIQAKTLEEGKKGRKLMLISALMVVIPLIIAGSVCGIMLMNN